MRVISANRPIAVFDSGVGGLSVVRALRRHLPAESILYLGDTARVPYGSKSPTTVARFVAEVGTFLARFDPKLMVAACNTASATGLRALGRVFAGPCVGVIEPGARAALEAARGRPIGLVATETTLATGAYRGHIRRIEPAARLVEHACPLFVPLVEDGRSSDDPVVRLVCEEYIGRFRDTDVAVLLLGCTHYPLLEKAIAQCLRPDVRIVDSAGATAAHVAALLDRVGLRAAPGTGSSRYFVTDNAARFRAIGRRFLGEPLTHVEEIDLAELTHPQPGTSRAA